MKYTYNSIKQSFHSQEAWINVFLFKHITVPLVYLMVNFTRITPNVISIISLIFGVVSAYLYFKGNLFVAGIMYLISYIFDATDGKVARIAKNGRPYGAWFDIAIDRINLTLISTAIAYNFFKENDSTELIFLNCLFLGLTFIGSESRYQIDLYKLKNNFKEVPQKQLGSYSKWCLSKGLIKEPISLPEIFLFYLIIAPQLGVELAAMYFTLIMLIARLFKQQLFWRNVN